MDSDPNKESISSLRASIGGKKRFFLLTIAVLAIATVTLTILRQRFLNLPPGPVGIAFVGNGKFQNNEGLRSGPTFLITNHTSKVLCVTPWAIEIRQGTNWAKWDHRAPTVFIAPHATAYETIDFSSQQYQQPTDNWRLTFNVAEKLAGVPAFFVKIKHYPRWLLHRNNPNYIFGPNPFTKGATWYGNPRRVLSEDILQHQEPISVN